MNRTINALAIAFLSCTTCLTATANEGPRPDDHEVKHVNPAEQRVIPFPGHTTIPLIEGADTVGGIAFLQFELPPKTFGAPPHIHQHEDEYAIIVEGTVRILTENGTITASAGEVATLPRGKLHGFWNNSDQPAKMIFGISNPSGFETFFDMVVERIRAEHPGSPQEVGALIAKVSATYDVQVFPDRIPAEAAALMPK